MSGEKMRRILEKFFVLLLLVIGILSLPHASESSDHGDDSDMWMEPDKLPTPEYSIVRSKSRVIRQYSSIPDRFISSGGFVPITWPNHPSVSRAESYEPEVVARTVRQNPQTAEQNFFPSFFRNGPLNAHSRPYKSVQSQQANTHAASIAGRYSANVARSNNFDQSILGSGDFTVVRGGTFYTDGDNRNYQLKSSDDFFGSYFNNGHGRPNADSLKQPYYPEDPFENFKDFADINAGSEPGFSHFVVIYANKNSTKSHPSHPSPKNIFEQLQLLDEEKKEKQQNDIEPKVKDLQTEDDNEKNREDEYDKKLMKLSKFKKKLAKTKVIKKYKKKLATKIEQQSLDYIDPLLATS